ncbi:cell wall-binding repeat-containing protein [Pseudalkalibacillus sp. Hm43]|uniref:cell wall-binding repeat-containing protein n=1 Tax=Pseudalkalibacillus sp. Hm43 TaxID=3450742 RepID=UPI003F440B0B
MYKKFVALILCFALTSFYIPQDSLAAESYENPSYSEINKLLTEKAIEKGIPPEIVKAVAYAESAWDQFKNGQPHITSDGGIGIMQVTDKSQFNEEKLKSDIEYNIDAGLQILLEKWNMSGKRIPNINDQTKDKLENWYFAVMAYNGLVPANSPVKKADGTINKDAYQYKVFGFLEAYNPGINLAEIKFNPSEFRYENDLLYFEKQLYKTEKPAQTTKHQFNDTSITKTVYGANIRSGPYRDSRDVGNIENDEFQTVTILDSFVYDQSHKHGTSDSGMRYKHYVWYKVQLKDGTIGYAASSTLRDFAERLSGKERYETAVEISKEGWKTADTVVLARAFDFPDALAGAPLAYHLNAPILLTNTGKLNDATKNEIKRLGAKKVVILGSGSAVSDKVKNSIKTELGITNIQRIGGKNRYHTAALIAEEMKKLGVNYDQAVVAYGWKFPDALAIAPYAARNGIPILLTNNNELPGYTSTALKGVKKSIVVGGTSMVSNNILKNLPDANRISGAERWDTNAEVVKKYHSTAKEAFVATGYKFADALTGSVLAAKRNTPILLVKTDSVPNAIQKNVTSNQMTHFKLLGGSDVVNVQYQLSDLTE